MNDIISVYFMFGFILVMHPNKSNLTKLENFQKYKKKRKKCASCPKYYQKLDQTLKFSLNPKTSSQKNKVPVHYCKIIQFRTLRMTFNISNTTK